MVDSFATTSDFADYDVMDYSSQADDTEDTVEVTVSKGQAVFEPKTSTKAKKKKKKAVVKVAVPVGTVAAREAVKSSKRKLPGFLLCGIAGGEIVLTALSLSHLALGVSIVTGHHDANWQDWAFASTFDVVMMLVKLAMVFSPLNDYNKDLHKYGKFFVAGCLVVSAGLNSLAFAQEAVGIMIYPAILFGILTPVGIFLLTKCLASGYIDYSRA